MTDNHLRNTSADRAMPSEVTGVRLTEPRGSLTHDVLQQAVLRLTRGRLRRPTSFDEMTPDQQTFVEEVMAGPRRGLDGTVQTMIASPVFGGFIQRAIAYVRFAGQSNCSSLPPKISELAILWAIRFWSAEYPWYVHRQAALAAGLNPSTVEAIREGTQPVTMEEDEAAAYDFCRELLLTKSVRDPTLERTRRLLGGDQGIVDLIGTLGAYQIVAMLSIVDQFPLPSGEEPQFLGRSVT